MLKRKSFLVFIFYLGVSFLLLYPIFISPGNIIGGDWGFPLTKIQIDQSFKGSFYTWGGVGAIFGARQTIFTTIFYQAIIKFLSLIGLTDAYTKILLLLLFTLAGFSMYLLAKYLKLPELISLLVGVLYITTPIFFNYAIMGWTFVLMAMGFLPLATIGFIRAVKEKSLLYAIITGILYAFAVIQSQSAIWFMLVFIMLSFYLIKDKESLLSYIKTIFIVIILFFLLNFYWLLGLVIVPDKNITGSNIVNSSVSLGNLGHLKAINIIRLFGSLYNFQYETVVNKFNQPILSFILPLLAISSLLIRKNRRIIVSLWLIGLIPLFIYLLNFYRNLLLYIPFSNVIRDFLRFAVLSSFAYPLLAGLFLTELLIQNKKIILTLLTAIALASAYPWFVDNIANWNAERTCDMRLRTKAFPKEYLRLEKDFSKKKLDQKAFYIPLGILDLSDDYRFHGTCNGVSDIFSGFSPIPGAITVTDRGLGYLTDYLKTIRNNLNSNLVDVLRPTNVNYFVIRKNTARPETQPLLESLNKAVKDRRLYLYSDDDKIAVLKTKNFLPHIYTPEKVIIADDSSLLDQIVNQPNYLSRSAIFFRDQNKERSKILSLSEDSRSNFNNKTTIEFKKISLVKYRVLIHQAEGTFPLVFNELFHDAWKSYLLKSNKFRQADNDKLINYQIITGNEADQATIQEVNEFIDRGEISSLGNSEKVNFISKKYENAIQNDNLSDGKFFETWLPDFMKQSNIINLPDEKHLMANSYANAWLIETQTICQRSDFCLRNSDGSYDLELIIEFWPQRLFFIGSIVSGLTLILSLAYIVYSKLKMML